KQFSSQAFPRLPNPTLLDLHSSLGNRDHIRAYILQAQNSIFPEGTGWEGKCSAEWTPTYSGMNFRSTSHETQTGRAFAR
ncbi:hypothetical protein B0H14DRAFT_2374732, partial [Mycena olivaceomarginata]